ncbi:MAG TPA: PIG-L family deacetylase [Actinomycetota bacterium]|nr:PIG-L family deacetylase [Actinomycetota bacterium]
MTTVLGIWAHPDDEVFTSGGFMADAVRRGERVVCLHLTRGEAGLYHRQVWPGHELASVRSAELAASLGRLGISEQRFLDLPDGGLFLVPWEEIVAQLHDELVEIHPDVIVTFGSDGFTGHSDHKVLSGWVSSAVRLWDCSRVRVLHPLVPHSWNDTVVHRLNEFDFFWPGQVQFSDRNDLTVRLDDELLEAKIDALKAHASQMEPLFEAYGEDFFRSIFSTEVFRPGVRPGFRSRMMLDLKQA